MSLNIRELLVVFIYGIVSNLVLVSLAQSGIGLTCPGLEDQLTGNYTIGNVTATSGETTTTASTFINLALNRCTGLSTTIFWIFEATVILGLLYVLRGFIGLT